MLSKKKASLQSDTYSMTSFIKAFKLAKRYNKMISDMNIYSKSIGECILSKNTNDYHQEGIEGNGQEVQSFCDVLFLKKKKGLEINMAKS